MSPHRPTGGHHPSKDRRQAAGGPGIDKQIHQGSADDQKPFQGVGLFGHRRQFQQGQQIIQGRLLTIVALLLQQPHQRLPGQPGGTVQALSIAAQPEQIVGHPAGQVQTIPGDHHRTRTLAQQADMPLGGRSQHPAVLAYPALSHRHLSTFRIPTDPGQRTGHHPMAGFGGYGKASDDHRMGLPALPLQHRGGGRLQGLPGHIAVRPGLDLLCQLRPGLFIEPGPDPAGTLGLDGGDHQLLQAGQDMGPLGGITAPPGPYSLQQQLLSQ